MEWTVIVFKLILVEHIRYYGTLLLIIKGVCVRAHDVAAHHALTNHCSYFWCSSQSTCAAWSNPHGYDKQNMGPVITVAVWHSNTCKPPSRACIYSYPVTALVQACSFLDATMSQRCSCTVILLQCLQPLTVCLEMLVKR